MNLKMMNDDVLLKKVKKQEYTGTQIIVGTDDDDDAQKFFEVLAVSPKVTSVVVGDVVIVPWPRITDPFEIEIDNVPTQVGITDQKEILAVIEED